MQPEERKNLLKELLEASDGTRADDYAALTAEFDEMQEEVDKKEQEIASLTEKNTKLKRENFRLFERVGNGRQEDDAEDVVEDDEPKKDYLKEVVDDKGFFRK